MIKIMEEKKLGKTVKMNAEKTGEEKRLSYEQLNDVCSQLYQENQKLYAQLQQANLANMFKRLDYLFKVLEYYDIINDKKFIDDCIGEIKSAMTIKEDSKEKEDSEED